MPKIKKLLSALSAVALCISLASCNSEKTPEEKNKIETASQTVYAQPETHKETVYNHVALQGAVIVEQNGKMNFKYKKKCEICGYVSSGTSGLTTAGGRYNSNFQCPDCGNNQKIQIETTKY